MSQEKLNDELNRLMRKVRTELSSDDPELRREIRTDALENLTELEDFSTKEFDDRAARNYRSVTAANLWSLITNLESVSKAVRFKCGEFPTTEQFQQAVLDLLTEYRWEE